MKKHFEAYLSTCRHIGNDTESKAKNKKIHVHEINFGKADGAIIHHRVHRGKIIKKLAHIAGEKKKVENSTSKKKEDKVYPYNHNSPAKSFKVCSCPNAQLYAGRLWKCPNTAFLRELLYVTGQEEDPEWQEYLVDGLPVDCSDAMLTEFCINSKLPESVCSMCTAKPIRFSAALQERSKRKVIPQNKY